MIVYICGHGNRNKLVLRANDDDDPSLAKSLLTSYFVADYTVIVIFVILIFCIFNHFSFHGLKTVKNKLMIVFFEGSASCIIIVVVAVYWAL